MNKDRYPTLQHLAPQRHLAPRRHLFSPVLDSLSPRGTSGGRVGEGGFLAAPLLPGPLTLTLSPDGGEGGERATLNTYRQRRRWLLAFLAILPAAAQAHPGHSWSEASSSHLLTNPDHLAVLAAVGCVSWIAALWVSRRLPRRLLQCAGVGAVAAAAVLWKFAA
jgi:peptidoglycan/LPS O-acetylase OafA/YrhL